MLHLHTTMTPSQSCMAVPDAEYLSLLYLTKSIDYYRKVGSIKLLASGMRVYALDH